MDYAHIDTHASSMLMHISIHMPPACISTHIPKAWLCACLYTCLKHTHTHICTHAPSMLLRMSTLRLIRAVPRVWTPSLPQVFGLAVCGRSRGAISATYNIPSRWSENHRQRIAQTTTATGVRNIAIDDTFRAAELRQSVKLIWAPILSKIKCLFFWSAGLVVACLCRRIGRHVNDND